MKKLLLIIAVLIAFVATAAAQVVTYMEREDIGISLGGQCSNHPSSLYWTGKTLVEMKLSPREWYSYIPEYGCKALEISAGPNYFSVSVPLFLISSAYVEYLVIGRHAFGLDVSVGFLSQGQLYYPIGKHFELTAGWNLFRFTKMKDISSAWYLTGSLNAGINFFATKNLFISAYYEFNHTYNPMIKTLNWSLGGLGVDITEQPRALIGHTIGLRVGWLLNLWDWN